MVFETQTTPGGRRILLGRIWQALLQQKWLLGRLKQEGGMFATTHRDGANPSTKPPNARAWQIAWEQHTEDNSQNLLT